VQTEADSKEKKNSVIDASTVKRKRETAEKEHLKANVSKASEKNADSRTRKTSKVHVSLTRNNNKLLYEKNI
jgi:hypothetical protein